MLKEKIKSTINFWNLPFGNIATASFIIAVVSGIFLALPYDVKNPYESISSILLLSPAGVFFRNVHYWSAQIFLVFTILHIIDHLKRKTEYKVKDGVWFRLTVSILITFFVMLSGFILKGDADSQQAFNIFSSLLKEIPFIGNSIALTLLGSEGDYQIIYVNHIATATIILSIIIIEHSKIVWPKISVFVYSFISSAVLGYIFSPMLHDGLNQIVKGPWYFVGLQELLHWISQTQLVLIFSFLLLIAFYLIKKTTDNISKIIKKSFVFLAAIYLLLTVIGYYFRGENWEFILPWNNTYKFISDIQPFASFSDIDLEKVSIDKLKSVLGRKEGCIVCHKMEGFESSHNPDAIGCYSCHRGNAFTLNTSAAHSGMILIPGNLDDAHLTCGTTQCHPDIIPRINNSIMSTLSGIVSVNRFVFDESDSPSMLNHIKEIKQSNADSHLRNLCASCHLGNPKTELGPINELSRGGGCNACHLSYNKDAIVQLNKYQKSKFSDKRLNEAVIELPRFHPQLNLNITNDHCFGCHSRSGRISTNYEGWFETLYKEDDIKTIKNSKIMLEYNDEKLKQVQQSSNRQELRILMDGRVFQKTDEDIHYKSGMECIDCHIAQEVMGDGNLYKHKEEQVKIQCIDCHSYNTKSISYEKLDYESRKIIDLKKTKRENTNFISTANGNLALTNSYQSENGIKYLLTKNNKDSLQLKPPAFICTEGKAHQRLSCNSCHTQWVSYCVGCHTEFNPDEEGFDLLDNKDIKGSWIEKASEFYQDYPTLGIKKDRSGKEFVDTFVPGMIIKIEKIKSGKNKKIFKRLFAPTFSHTVNKNGRNCKSCHNNSLALGYGKGEMKFSDDGKWSFQPQLIILPEDNLPMDAWIGFLKTRDNSSTTRQTTRPFYVDEQKRILTVGACLTCHQENSKVMREALADWQVVLKRVSKKCVLPKY